MKKLSEYLIDIGASTETIQWAAGKTLSDFWASCERGDWMLRIAKESGVCDLRTLTLMKAKCASLAKPHMKDQSSLAAIQAAFDFASGLISEDQLRAAYFAAYVAAAYASSDAAYVAAAAYAADAAASTASIDGYAVAYAAVAAAYAVAYAAANSYADYSAFQKAREDVFKKCADICREVLPTIKINGVE